MINLLQKSSCLSTIVTLGLLQLAFFPTTLKAQTLSFPQKQTPNIPPLTSPQNKTPVAPTLPYPQDKVPNAQDSLKNPKLDDITNTPTQLTTWVCNNGDKQIAVETKEITFWNQLTEANKSWQCSQNIPTIADKKRSFSCEPNDTMGLISVYWLKGKDGKATMQGWMDSLANKYNMVCTRTETNVYWE
jgi:hypothetical protein